MTKERTHAPSLVIGAWSFIGHWGLVIRHSGSDSGSNPSPRDSPTFSAILVSHEMSTRPVQSWDWSLSGKAGLPMNKLPLARVAASLVVVAVLALVAKTAVALQSGKGTITGTVQTADGK